MVHQNSLGDLKRLACRVTGCGLEKEERLGRNSVPKLLYMLQVIASDRNDLHDTQGDVHR